jgi:hypothetical protein
MHAVPSYLRTSQRSNKVFVLRLSSTFSQIIKMRLVSVIIALTTCNALAAALPHLGFLHRRSPSPAVPTYAVVDVLDPEAEIPGFPVVNGHGDDQEVTITKTVTHTPSVEKTVTQSFTSTTTLVSIVNVQQPKTAVMTVTVVPSENTPELPSSSSSPASSSEIFTSSSTSSRSSAPVETSRPTAATPAGLGADSGAEAESSATMSGVPTATAPLFTAVRSLPPAPTGTGFDDGMWRGQGLWNSTTVAFRFRRDK